MQHHRRTDHCAGLSNRWYATQTTDQTRPQTTDQTDRQSPVSSQFLTAHTHTHTHTHTKGYSASDLTELCRDAALGPVRELGSAVIACVRAGEIRPIARSDFESSLRNIRPSVSPQSLKALELWNQQYGSC